MEDHMSRKLLSYTALGLILGNAAFADVPKVAVDIAPVHSLVSRVMEGVGTPKLVIPAGASPHGYSLRPSEAKALQDADMVIWMGEDLAPWMENSIETLSKNADVITLLEESETKLLEFREGALFEEHDHGDHDDHDDHDDHAGHEGHNHGEFDAHIWLDPSNAKEMVHEIAHELGDLDPANKDKYEANAEATIIALDQLIKDVSKDINKDAKFVVFHDAYQYFEERFGVRAAGALTLNTDVLPGAKQIDEIQDVIKDRGINCIFSEPQFNPKIISTIAEDTNIKTGVFDPLGANINSDKDLYFKLISNLGNELKGC